MTKERDFQLAAKWAHDLLKTEFCIFDSETTGLQFTDQIVQMAVIDQEGNTLLDEYVLPTVPISPEATAIHGIDDDKVAHATTFEELLLPLMKAVGKRDVVIYNAEFDLKMIRHSIKPHGIQLAFPRSDRRQCKIFTNGGSIHCAREYYSQWIGEWDSYHRRYTWQKLPDGDHTALGDCRATLAVIQKMAESYQAVDPSDDDDIPFLRPVLMHLDDLSAKRLQKLEIQNGALIYTVKTTLLLVQQLAAGHPINPEHLNGLIHSLEVLSDSPNR